MDNNNNNNQQQQLQWQQQQYQKQQQLELDPGKGTKKEVRKPSNMTAEHENDSRVRLRRTKSVTHAEEIQKAELLVRKSQPDKP